LLKIRLFYSGRFDVKRLCAIPYRLLEMLCLSCLQVININMDCSSLTIYCWGRCNV